MLKVRLVIPPKRVCSRAVESKTLAVSLVISVLILLVAAPALAQRGNQDKLERMTLAELLDMKVTSVSKKEDPRSVYAGLAWHF